LKEIFRSKTNRNAWFEAGSDDHKKNAILKKIDGSGMIGGIEGRKSEGNLHRKLCSGAQFSVCSDKGCEAGNRKFFWERLLFRR